MPTLLSSASQSSRPRKRSHRPTWSYLTVEVSCFDLARLLDYCSNAYLRLSDGVERAIEEIPWYSDAYKAIDLDFFRVINTGRRARK